MYPGERGEYSQKVNEAKGNDVVLFSPTTGVIYIWEGSVMKDFWLEGCWCWCWCERDLQWLLKLKIKQFNSKKNGERFKNDIRESQTWTRNHTSKTVVVCYH